MSGKDESIFSKSALMGTKPGKQIIKQGLFKSKGFKQFNQYKQEAEDTFPAFATENKLSSITDGVITDLTNGDMYWASKNKGSFFNEKQIRVQQKEPIYKIV